MKTPSTLNKLAVAVSLLAGSQAAMALTPWTNGAPFITIYTSGGSAQDKAVTAAIQSAQVSVSGTLDIFQDTTSSQQRVNGTLTTVTTNGGNFTAYYFTGSNSLTDTALRGKQILLVKRTLGSAGYGVVPLLDNSNLDNLNITATTAANWSGAGKTHLATITQANASTYLTQVPSHGGFTGVDAPALLQGGYNYPLPVNEVSTGAPVAPFTTNYTAASLTAKGITRIPTGGETYGIAVTTDLYKVLQAAQIADGSLTLPAGHAIGSYASDGDLPSLSRNFVAALLAGNVQTWANVLVNDTTLGSTPLTSYASAAGVTAPANNVVGVGIRNAGAAIGAVGYAKFLGYPYVPNASAPPTAIADTSADEFAAAPLVKAPTGATDTDNLLNDWQFGDNTSGHNNVTAVTSGDPTSLTNERIWGLAIQTADRNNTGTLGYRYIKIDGAAPTIPNIANGTYPVWAEGEVLISSHATASESLFLKDFGKALGSAALAGVVDASLTEPYGQSGIFATVNSDATVTNFANVPFVASQPVVPYSHGVSGFTSLGIVPYATDAAKDGNPNVILK
ncbi:hypothetical protein [Methylomonas sp. AM2-LC]|uniref:hypothetical protein n=1 Tax=Methylomonas sp. AM2-LC TaxID=3153301 RepID=UPI003264179A